MRKYDADGGVFNFPLAVHLDGKDLWLMVQGEVFTGGMFYIVRGKDIQPLHILCVFEDDDEKGKLHFTVMNEDTAREALVAVVLHALQEPFDGDEQPNEGVSDGLPSE